MKKKLLIFSSIFALVLIIFLGLVTQFPEEEPEPEESFHRSYPDVIKGNWEPSPFHMKQLMEEEVDELRDLGVNTVSISLEYRFGNDGSYSLDEMAVTKNLYSAKKNDFAVLVAPNFVGSAGVNFEEMGIDMTLERFLQISREVALKWAEISENYKAEFFAPQNEIDHMIQSNFPEENVSEIVSEWHQEIVGELKNVFHGKLMAKMASIRPDDDFSGYDYVGTTIVHFGMSLEQFREGVRNRYTVLSQVAEKSGSEWLISEFWMPYYAEYWPLETEVDLDECQDDYYRIAAEEYLNFEGEEKPAGFIFIAWLMPGMEIKGRDASTVMENFFESI